MSNPEPVRRARRDIDLLRREPAWSGGQGSTAGLRLLVEAGQVLASSLDYEATLRNIAELAVPDFVDWCAVDLLDEGGDLRRVAVAHPDPARVELARRYMERYPPQRHES